MSDFVTSWLRTAVPALWGSVIAWAVGANLLPAELVEQAEGFAVVLVAVVVALYYAAARWVEAQPWAPGWVSRLLLGSKEPPTYQGRVAAGASSVDPYPHPSR